MKKHLLILLISIFSTSVYSQEGSNDSTFNPTDVGFGFGDGPNLKVICTAQQSDGKLIIGGEFTMYNGAPANYITRLNLDGTVDATFNTGTGANNTVKTIAIQSDGKILIGGSFTNYNGANSQHIARLNTDGTKDTTFVSGPGTIDNDINAIAIAPNGNIAIGGKFMQYIGYDLHHFAYLNPDGTVNGPFMLARTDNDVNAIKFQSDGKIILGGAFTLVEGISRNRIARLDANGTLDATFVPAGTGSNTGANNTVNVVAIQNDGKIIVGGYFTAYGGATSNGIVRINSTGIKDATFNVGGSSFEWIDIVVSHPPVSIFSVVIKNDGKIFVGGDFASYNGNSCYSIVKLNSDGTEDNSFCFGSQYTTSVNSNYSSDSIRTILIQSDGKILIGGAFNRFFYDHHRIIRFTSNGMEDYTFNPGTGVACNNFGPKNIVIQTDNKMIITGSFRFYNGVNSPLIARLNTNGSLDTSFNTSALNIDLYVASISAIALQNDDKALIYGRFNGSNGSLIRLNNDGSKDTSFNPILNGAVSAIKVQADGKILIGGSFTQVNGVTRNSIARLNSNGSLDTTFNLAFNITGSVFAIEITTNSYIVLGGSFTSPTNCNLISITPTGTLNGNNGALGINGNVNSLAVLSDGQILAGGNFTYLGGYNNLWKGSASNYIGSFSANAGLALNGSVTKIALQCDGKIIIVGSFTTFNGIARNGIARLNADGTLDTTFNPGTGGTSINTMALQNDGKIMIGGTFTSYNGVGRNRVARVLATDVIPTETAGTITGAVNVCKGGALQAYMLPIVTGATSYVWTLPPGASIQTNYGNGIVVNFNGVNATSGNITAQAILPITKCHPVNPISVLPINIYSPITNIVAITGTNSVCRGSTYTYSVPLESNVTSYQWTLPTGATGTSTTNSISVTYSINTVPGNITVKRLNTCGTSTDTVLPISISTIASTAGVISGDILVCKNQSIIYSVTPIAGASIYMWSYPTGITGPSTTTTNSVTVLVSSLFAGGTISVKGNNGCSDFSGVASLVLNLNIPAGPSVNDQIFCSSNNSKISNLVAVGSNIKWYYAANSTNPLSGTTLLVNNHTYYATQTVDGCESNMIAGLVTIVDPPGAPGGFDFSFCIGDPVSLLVSEIYSFNYLQGFCYVSPTAVNPIDPSTLMVNGTTYYCSQTQDGVLCEGPRVPVTVTVFTSTPPTGNAIQSFTVGQTLSNLQVTGVNLKWYASQSDATNQINEIANTTLLVSGTTYYVTQTSWASNTNPYHGCVSAPLAITVNAALGLNQIQKDHFVYYPNPVNNVVNFENNYPIKKITLFNLLGQRVEEKEINSLSGQLDMSKLPTGNYLLKIKTDNGESTIKLVKN